MNIYSTGGKKMANMITHTQFMMTLYTFHPTPPPHSQMFSTWRKQTDGHQQHMFLLLQVELLQAHLELHQWLEQLQSVARCGRHNTSLLSVQRVRQAPYYITGERPPRALLSSHFLINI